MNKLFIVFCIIFLILFNEQIDMSPNHAIVLLSHSKKQYTSPPCVEYEISDSREFNDVSTQFEARELGYKVDKKCVNARFGINNDGGFTQTRLIIIALLENYLGLKINPSRWNKEGEWRY